ncbi:MAG: hypothetical protein DWQ37_13700 [Planctomycetota bacterium]|nr:MAG: hypothetical protein DWQ37_13700 [Planctomycetota bacterium]
MRSVLRLGNLLAIGCLVSLVSSRSIRADDLPIPTIVEGSVLPPDAAMALYVRPAELASSKSAAPIVEAFDAVLEPLKLGLSVADIEEFKIVFIIDQQAGLEGVILVVRARAAHDWKPMFDAQGKWKEEEFQGRKVFRRVSRQAYWLPDERTAVFTESRNATMLARSMGSPDPQDKAAWFEAWSEAARRPLAGLIDMRVLSGGNPGRDEDPLAVLATDAKYAVASGYFTIGGFQLEGSITTDSPQAAARVAPATSQVLVDFVEEMFEAVPLEDDDKAGLAAQLNEFLGKSRIKTDGKLVKAEGRFTTKMIQVICDAAKKVAKRM